jgi:hypothetical protein
MQYCDILDVENITDATAVDLLLQRYGYKIVSAQVAPSSCPAQQKVKSCDDYGLITQPAAPTFRVLQAEQDFRIVQTDVSRRKENSDEQDAENEPVTA